LWSAALRYLVPQTLEVPSRGRIPAATSLDPRVTLAEKDVVVVLEFLGDHMEALEAPLDLKHSDPKAIKLNT